MSEPLAGSRPRLPVVNLREARPYLEAPFPAQTIGVFARREPDQAAVARVVFFPPIRQVEARLTYVFGLGNWSPGTPSVLDARSLSCTLTVLGKTHEALGQGADRLAQAANGTKHCALQLGVGSYLAQIEPLTYPIGKGPEEVQVAPNGRLTLPRALEDQARRHYASEIDRLARQIGTPLEHAPQAWNQERVPLGRARGLAAIAAGLLDRAERHTQPRPRLLSVLEMLIAITPGGLAGRTHARRATTAPTDERMGDLIEIDFAALGPKPQRQAA